MSTTMYAVGVKLGQRSASLGLLAALSTALPLLAFAFRFGVAAPLSLFQADAFYYLDITRNSAGRRGFTFDGLHPTNGFHPLWQWLLSFSRWLGLLHFADPRGALVHVFLIDTALLGCGAALFTYFAAHTLRHKPLALLVTAPGLLWFAATPITQGYLCTWSYANGMESALSLAIMALALSLFSVQGVSAVRDLGFSLVLGFAVLARLDDVFFLVAIGLWAVFILRPPVRRTLLWTAPACCLILAYVLYNRHTVGTFLPISGISKAGFAAGENLRWAGKLIVPMLTKSSPSVLDQGPPDSFAVEAIRAFQMVVPPVLCLAELYLGWRRQRNTEQGTESSTQGEKTELRTSNSGHNPGKSPVQGSESRPHTDSVILSAAKDLGISPGPPQLNHRRSGLVHALCAGVVLKGLYNFFFVAGHNQGLWYYTVSVAVANLVLVLWLDRLSTQLWPKTTRSLAWVPAYLLLVLYSFSALYGTVSTAVPPTLSPLLDQGPGIAAKLQRNGDHCITEFDDGFTSFALRMPAQAGLGLALDLEAAHAARHDSLLPLLERRGCTLLVTSPAYDGAVRNYLATHAWNQGTGLFSLNANEFRHFQIVPLDRLDSVGLGLFRIQPLPTETEPNLLPASPPPPQRRP